MSSDALMSLSPRRFHLVVDPPPAQPKEEEVDIALQPRSYSQDLSYLLLDDATTCKEEADENVDQYRGIKRRLSTEEEGVGDADDGDKSDSDGAVSTRDHREKMATDNVDRCSGPIEEGDTDDHDNPDVHHSPLVRPDPHIALVLPAHLVTNELPAEYRKFLVGIRESACTLCIKQDRAECWQSSARSWKCQCCHEKRKKCSWQFVSGQHGLGNKPPVKKQMDGDTPLKKKSKVNSAGTSNSHTARKIRTPRSAKKSIGPDGGASLHQDDSSSSSIFHPAPSRHSPALESASVSTLFLPAHASPPPSIPLTSLAAPPSALPPVPTLQLPPCAGCGTVDLLHEIKTGVDSSNLGFATLDEKIATFQKNVDRQQQEHHKQFATFKQEIIELVMKATVRKDHRDVAVQTERDE
ncbi:hypothetical protein LXA43DRAFT_1063369 [Ganoderma leucocontextum]|nr:hypothetical protein LXA43DRAFT_1063369 [Ganoderma leucocontextum]